MRLLLGEPSWKKKLHTIGKKIKIRKEIGAAPPSVPARAVLSETQIFCPSPGQEHAKPGGYGGDAFVPHVLVPDPAQDV